MMVHTHTHTCPCLAVSGNQDQRERKRNLMISTYIHTLDKDTAGKVETVEEPPPSLST